MAGKCRHLHKTHFGSLHDSPFWLKLNDKIALKMSIFLSKFIFLDHLGQKSLVPGFGEWNSQQKRLISFHKLPDLLHL